MSQRQFWLRGCGLFGHNMREYGTEGGIGVTEICRTCGLIRPKKEPTPWTSGGMTSMWKFLETLNCYQSFALGATIAAGVTLAMCFWL